jgi:hypothetical protein
MLDHSTSERCARSQPGGMPLARRSLPVSELPHVDAGCPPVTQEDVFAFFRDSGYLHGGRLPGITRSVVETTWKRLLAADGSVFRLIARREVVDGRPALQTMVCAFAHAPGTWQIQHLVSAQRRGRTGTLAVIAAILRWGHGADVHHFRWAFRPANPSAQHLFASAVDGLPRDLIVCSLVDYGATACDAIRLIDDASVDVRVTRVGADTAADTIAFYRQRLHPIELESLALADPELESLAPPYRAAGLVRSRTVLRATIANRVVGACLVNHSSPGLNLAGFGSAIEHLRVADDLDRAARRSVWTALARAAVADARRSGGYIITALDPADREMAVAAGLVSTRPKQYAIATVSRREDGFLRMLDCFTEYYAARLGASAAAEATR